MTGRTYAEPRTLIAGLEDWKIRGGFLSFASCHPFIPQNLRCAFLLGIKKNGSPRRRQNPTAMVASMRLPCSKIGIFKKLVLARLAKANILVMPERARLTRERVRAYVHPLSGYPKNRCKLSVTNPRDLTAIGIHNGRCPVVVK